MTRDEAVQEIKEASDSEVRHGDTEHHYDEVMKRVEAFGMAIKALEQTRWVLVSERQPKEEGDYLVILRFGWMHFREVCYFDGNTLDKGGYDEVVKWQYLPNIEESEG